jgi:uncharacterized protein (TIGR02284 family)
MKASLRRVWGEFKANLGGGDQSLLYTATQDGDVAIKMYDEALKKELPLPVRQLLSTQAAHIQLFNEYITTVHNIGK